MFPRNEQQDTAAALQEDFDEFMEGQLELNNWEHVALVAGHDAECQMCSEDVSTYRKLTKREQAIVLKLWEEFGNGS